jgi:Chitobiase/beta-hexosaminidase C-terminal domain
MNKTLDLFLIFGLLAGVSLAQTVATPTFSQPTGSYINSVFVTIRSTTPGVTICYSLTGGNPTAVVAGRCDSGFYSSTGAFAAITVSGTTLKAIGTKVGLVNSAVASATYTITTQAATNPISAATPVNITSAGAHIVDEAPFMITTSHGFLLFYSESTDGKSIDGDSAYARVMFKTSPDGATWSPPTSVSCISGDPSTGCLYSLASTCSGASGGGIDSTGTVILLMAQDGASGGAPIGVVEMTATWSGSAWTWTSPTYLTTPSETNHNQFINPTANMISIPSGSSGVTGACASGCSFIPVLGENGGSTGLIFTYNHGSSWSDPVPIPPGWPYMTEERALIWLGGMNLLMFNRPTDDVSTIAGWPTALMVLYSSNLGSTWNSYSWLGSTPYGSVSNLPLPACVGPPNAFWFDTLTRPSVATDPQNPALSTLLYGERYQCNSTGVRAFRWNIVTFNASSAFSNAGQNLPLQQVLNLDPITTVQPHTTYSYMVPLNSTQLLMAYEQGNTTTTEDIYTTVLSYTAGTTALSGGVKLNGGVSVH